MWVSADTIVTSGRVMVPIFPAWEDLGAPEGVVIQGMTGVEEGQFRPSLVVADYPWAGTLAELSLHTLNAARAVFEAVFTVAVEEVRVGGVPARFHRSATNVGGFSVVTDRVVVVRDGRGLEVTLTTLAPLSGQLGTSLVEFAETIGWDTSSDEGDGAGEGVWSPSGGAAGVGTGDGGREDLTELAETQPISTAGALLSDRALAALLGPRTGHPDRLGTDVDAAARAELEAAGLVDSAGAFGHYGRVLADTHAEARPLLTAYLRAGGATSEMVVSVSEDGAWIRRGPSLRQMTGAPETLAGDGDDRWRILTCSRWDVPLVVLEWLGVVPTWRPGSAAQVLDGEALEAALEGDAGHGPAGPAGDTWQEVTVTFADGRAPLNLLRNGETYLSVGEGPGGEDIAIESVVGGVELWSRIASAVAPAED